MLTGLLASSRARRACLCLASLVAFVAFAGVGGCGSSGSNAVTVTGKTLIVYLSAPADLHSDPQAQDVIDAEKLAFHQLSGGVRGFTLRMQVLTAPKASDNARTAISDTTSIAYLGEVEQGSSPSSLGITNAQDLLQVSPVPSGPVPTTDFESFSTYGRTFASIAPGQDSQALLAGSAGKMFTGDFRSSYGHDPSAEAIFGYVATAALLKALEMAGSAANNRATVRDDFFKLKNVPILVGPAGSELGACTVDKNGTVTITSA